MRYGVSHLLILSMLLFSSVSAQARSLYWEDFTVDARLLKDGSLHVIEKQHFVFDGNWNGGERNFRIGWNENLTLKAITRIDPETQKRTRLVKGDLDVVDHYKFTSGNVLRWRSRNPASAAFNNRHIIYELEYIHSGVLKYEDDRYILNHNFAFNQRPGEFRHFRLDFTVDPAWQTLIPFQSTIEEQHLAPGQGVYITTSFRYQGIDTPAAISLPIPVETRLGLLSALVFFVLFYLVNWIRHEHGKGRFEPLLSLDKIDQDWLEQHIFSESPENIGSLWDLDTGSAEVAAMLARLTQENKLKSEVKMSGFWIFKKPVLHLELLVHEAQLSGTELSVIRKLFPGGIRTTSSDLIREHYKEKGFDPASSLQSRLKGYRLLKNYEKSPAGFITMTKINFLLAMIFIIIALFTGKNREFILLIPAGMIAILGLVMFYIKINQLRIEVEHPWLILFKFLFYYLLLTSAVGFFIISGIASPSIWIALTFIFILAGLFSFIMDNSRTHVKPEKVQMRKTLCAARRYLRHELTKPQPRLRDEWYPYLLAFGLDHSMDKWLRTFSGSTTDSADSDFGSSHTGSSTGSWTGGGGSFAGAGATGSWTAAAASMSAGFAAPSSGSDSGGGGGSSGGGGGGGW